SFRSLCQPVVEVRAVPQSGQAVKLGPLREHLDERANSHSRANTGLEFCNVKGLGDEVDRAQLQAPHLGGSVHRARDEDDGNVMRHGIALELAQNFKAILDGHIDIQQDNIRQQGGGQCDAVIAVVGVMDLDAFVLESRLEKSMDQRRVVDGQQTRDVVLYWRHAAISPRSPANRGWWS